MSPQRRDGRALVGRDQRSACLRLRLRRGGASHDRDSFSNVIPLAPATRGCCPTGARPSAHPSMAGLGACSGVEQQGPAATGRAPRRASGGMAIGSLRRARASTFRHDRRGRCSASADEGDSWSEIAATSPANLSVQSRPSRWRCRALRPFPTNPADRLSRLPARARARGGQRRRAIAQLDYAGPSPRTGSASPAGPSPSHHSTWTVSSLARHRLAPRARVDVIARRSHSGC